MVSDVLLAETAGTSSEDRAPRARLPLRAVLTGALVLALATAATLGYFLVADQGASPTEVNVFLEGQRPHVHRRAVEVLTLIVNFDATNIDQRRERLLQITTGTFREQYEEAFQNLGEGLRSISVSSRGDIVEGPTVSFVSASEAIALATLSETIQSDDDPAGVTFLNEIKLTLVHTADGAWKADRAEILSTREA